MIIQVIPDPIQDWDPESMHTDAAAIAKAVEQVGALRGWRVTQVQVWDEMEGAFLFTNTDLPSDE